MLNKKNKNSEIVIDKKKLPLSCPAKQTWDSHPKIYLTFNDNKITICPYCSTKYKFIN